MIITFTNVIGAIRNAISSVITTNLKMWLGFETSETLGREEVVNGDFALDSDWSEGTGWDIDEVNNKATCDGTQTDRSSLFQTGVLQQNVWYQFEFTLKNVTNGNVRLRNGIGASEIYISDKSLDDTYIVVTKVIASNQTLVVDADVDFIGSVTNISVKELTQITPDKSGNNNVGELFTGKALEFNGAGDYVDIDFTTPIKSAVFWVKPLDTGLENILWFGGAFGASKYIRSNGNVIQTAGLSSVSVYVDGVQTTSVPLNEWSRVVVNFASVTPSELKFGYAFNSYGYIQLSDVQFYDENLSTDDVAYDYANPNKLAIDNPSTSLSVTNLKAYWALSEGDGLVAYDSGTNLEEEEVENGDFSDGTNNWSEEGSSTISVGTHQGKTDVANINILNTSNGSRIKQAFDYVNGQTYQVSVEVYLVSGSFRVDSRDSFVADDFVSTTTTGSWQTLTATITAIQTGTDVVWLRSDDEISQFYVNSISIREVTASDHGGLVNGATYVDAQPRIPQLGMMNWSKGSNLVTHSENFTDNSWTKLGAGTGDVAIVTSNFDTSPIGTQNATRLQCDLSGGTTTADQSLIYDLDSSNTSQCISIYMKSNNGSNQNIYFTNTFTGDNRDNAIVTTDWQRFEFKHTTSNHTFSLGLRGGTGSDDTADILIWGAQSENSSSVSAYRLTDGGATLNSTVIPNPTIPTKDIFGNLVRDRLNSFNLDGTGYAEVADDTDLDFGTGDFSVEAWVRFEFKNQGSSLNTIYSNGEEVNDTNTFSLVSDQNNKIGFYVNGTSCFSTSTFSKDNWVHVVGTRIQGTNGVKLYINGNTTPEATTTNNNTVTNSFDKTIGYDTHASRYYNNIISDVRVYSQALTSDEIENNYNAGLSAHTN